MEDQTTKLLNELEIMIKANPGVSITKLVDIALEFSFGGEQREMNGHRRKKLTFSNSQIYYALKQYNKMRNGDGNL